jgi:hypothetical protein
MTPNLIDGSPPRALTCSYSPAGSALSKILTQISPKTQEILKLFLFLNKKKIMMMMMIMMMMTKSATESTFQSPNRVYRNTVQNFDSKLSIVPEFDLVQ